MQRCEPVSKKDIEITLESLQKHYNEEIEQQKEASVQGALVTYCTVLEYCIAYCILYCVSV